MNNLRLMKTVYAVLLGAAVIVAVLGLAWIARRSLDRRPISIPVAKEPDRRTTSSREAANQDAALTAVGDLVFSDANTAWQLDYKGELLMTRDAGESWVPVGGEVTKTFEDFTIVDGFRGLAADDTARIWKTDDGGYTWYLVSSLPSPNEYQGASQILFDTQGRGLVVDTFAVWQTQDNGSSWHEVDDLSSTKHQGRVRQISFLDSKNGWAICDGGLVFHTDDGGNHWNVANGNLSFDFYTTLETIQFLDEDHGWIAVSDAPQPYPERVVLFTEDGGKTWRRQKEISDRVSIYQISFVDQKTGWLAGSEHLSVDEELGVLFATDDGGRTWRRVETIPNRDPIRSVRFFSSAEGWLTTDYDIYRTDDGGKNWVSVLSYPEVRERNRRILGS